MMNTGYHQRQLIVLDRNPSTPATPQPSAPVLPDAGGASEFRSYRFAVPRWPYFAA